jgi:hypothetical protein
MKKAVHLLLLVISMSCNQSRDTSLKSSISEAKPANSTSIQSSIDALNTSYTKSDLNSLILVSNLREDFSNLIGTVTENNVAKLKPEQFAISFKKVLDIKIDSSTLLVQYIAKNFHEQNILPSRTIKWKVNSDNTISYQGDLAPNFSSTFESIEITKLDTIEKAICISNWSDSGEFGSTLWIGDYVEGQLLNLKEVYYLSNLDDEKGNFKTIEYELNKDLVQVYERKNKSVLDGGKRDILKLDRRKIQTKLLK